MTDTEDLARIAYVRQAYAIVTRELIRAAPARDDGSFAIDLVSGVAAELATIMVAIRETNPALFPVLLEDLLAAIRRDIEDRPRARAALLLVPPPHRPH